MTTPTRPASSNAAHWAVRVITALCLLIVLGQIAACGGGGDDDPDAPTPRVDCLARPELCK